MAMGWKQRSRLPQHWWLSVICRKPLAGCSSFHSRDVTTTFLDKPLGHHHCCGSYRKNPMKPEDGWNPIFTISQFFMPRTSWACRLQMGLLVRRALSRVEDRASQVIGRHGLWCWCCPDPAACVGYRGMVHMTTYLHCKEILGVAEHFIKKFHYAYRLFVRSVWDSVTSKALKTPTHIALFSSIR